MIRVIRIFACFIAICALPNSALAWKVVMDPYCLKAVTTNLATQKAIEDQHNNRLDSISSKQNKIMQYTASMATIKEAYKYTLENIQGFGPESRYYVEIGLCAFDILKYIPDLVATVNDAKFSNKVLCLGELSDVVLRTQQLVADFVNIVNNGKIQNPLKGQATAQTTGDGYNLLDRYDRLTVANRIYVDLLEIRYRLEGMMMMARYATLNDLFFKVDPEGWSNMMAAKNQVQFLVISWNSLGLNSKI